MKNILQLLPNILLLLAIAIFVFVNVLQIFRNRNKRFIRIQNLAIPEELKDTGLTIHNFSTLLDIKFQEIIPRKTKSPSPSLDQNYFSLLWRQNYSITDESIRMDEISTDNFWGSVFHYFSKIYTKHRTTVFDISINPLRIQNYEGYTHTCTIYQKTGTFKNVRFNFLKESKNNYHDLIYKIAYHFLQTTTPPCLLNSHLIYQKHKQNNGLVSSEKIEKQERLTMQIQEKLSLLSRGFCNQECSQIVHSKKVLESCNKLKGYMLIPLGILVRHHKVMNISDSNKKEKLFTNIDKMSKALHSFYDSHNWLYKEFRRYQFKNKLRWLTFLETTTEHQEFVNSIYYELQTVNSEVLFNPSAPMNFLRKLKERSQSLQNDYNKHLKKYVRFICRDRKLKSYFYHNLADLFFRTEDNPNAIKLVKKNLNRALNLDRKRGLSWLDLAISLFYLSPSNNHYVSHLKKFFKRPIPSFKVEAQIFKHLIQLKDSLNSADNSVVNILSNQKEKKIVNLKNEMESLSNILSFLKPNQFLYKCIVYNLSGITALLLGNYLEAKKNLIAALEEAAKLGSSQWWFESILKNNLAIIEWYFGNTRDSEIEIYKSIAICRINPYILKNREIIAPCSKILPSRINHLQVVFKHFRTANHLSLLTLTQNTIINGFGKKQGDQFVHLGITYI